MIRKSGNRFSLGTNAKRLPGGMRKHLEAQASIRVDSSLRAFASLWAIVRPGATAPITNTFDEASLPASDFVFRVGSPPDSFPSKNAPAAFLGVTAWQIRTMG